MITEVGISFKSTGYPHEAPFLVRSAKWADKVVRDPDEFALIRMENTHPTLT